MSQSRSEAKDCNQRARDLGNAAWATSTSIFRYLKRNVAYYNYYGQPSGNVQFPYHQGASTKGILLDSKVGEATSKFADEVAAATEKALKAKKGACEISIGPMYGYVIHDPKLIAEIYDVKNVGNLASGESVKLFGHYFHDKVIMAQATEDKEYEPTRAVYNNALLTDKALKRNVESINTYAAALATEILDAKSDEVNLSDLATKFTMSFIFKTLIRAEDVSPEDMKTIADYVRSGISDAVKLRNMAKIAFNHYLPQFPYKLLGDAHTTTAKSIIKKIVDANKNAILNEKKLDAAPENSDVKGATQAAPDPHDVSIIKAVMKAEKEKTGKEPDITSDRFLSEVAFIVTAGSDTTSSLMQFCFLKLLSDPEILKKVREEIAAFKQLGEAANPLDPNALLFTKCVILETLRLHPPLPVQKALVKTGFTLSNGIQLAPGDNIILNVGAAHRLDEYYPEPLKFNPNRFYDMIKGGKCTLDDFFNPFPKKDFPFRYAFLPFGKGKRMCPGRRSAFSEILMSCLHFAPILSGLVTPWNGQTEKAFGQTPDSKQPLLARRGK